MSRDNGVFVPAHTPSSAKQLLQLQIARRAPEDEKRPTDRSHSGRGHGPLGEKVQVLVRMFPWK